MSSGNIPSVLIEVERRSGNKVRDHCEYVYLLDKSFIFKYVVGNKADRFVIVWN